MSDFPLPLINLLRGVGMKKRKVKKVKTKRSKAAKKAARTRKKKAERKRKALKTRRTKKMEVRETRLRGTRKRIARIYIVYMKRRQIGRSVRSRDAKRKALPPGKRISRTGHAYYEYRKNRSDLGKV